MSASWTTPQSVVTAFEREGALVRRRASDWGRGRWRRLLGIASSTVAAVWAARREQRLVLLTAGYEVFAAVMLVRLLRASRRPQLAVADFLVPSSRRLAGVQALLLRQVDKWWCVRSGDIQTLADLFGVDPDRCTWVPFPLSADLDEFTAVSTSRPSLLGGPLVEGYVYSAGTAHRNWPMLLDALQEVGCPAVLALDATEPALRGRRLPARVHVVGRVSPEEGRALAARAEVVVVALQDTHLPAGPLVLADALALGKAVVATDVNGTRDYVIDGLTARVVPPDDTRALATALRDLLADDALRQRLGWAARAWTLQHLSPGDFARAVLA